MAMHDARRQQAYERAQDIELMRESYVVTVELEKEKAAYERWLELHDRQNRLRRKRQIQEAEHLKMIEKRRADLARQKERLLQERLQRIESAARYSYRGSSNRLPSTFLSQNTSMHEDMSNRRFSMERQTTNLNSRKQYDGNRWEDPNEGSADRGLNTNGGSHAAASRTSRLGGSAARRSVPPGESNTDLERTRVSTIVSHTRAWR
ncbi:unnamed protein product [Phytomonas sp. EM1]|nr:unnamed protein product [Phytomonas sp. EM1]|eukprot:CCW64590.1 unnamed protein product [Phytomonas sp. isolate EM1]